MVGSWRLSCGNILINLLFHLDADEDADIVLEDNVNSVNGLLAKAEVQYHQGSFEHSLKFYYKYVLVNIFLQLFLIVVQTFIASSVYTIYRAYRARPEFKKTLHGINKAKAAIENSLSRTNGFSFLQMKDIIEEIIREEEYKSKEAERYILFPF